MKILYNFATRSRPEKCLKCVKNIIEMSSSANFIIHVKIDEDDETCNVESFIDVLECHYNVLLNIGTSKNKTHAINRDIPIDGFDIICSHSDDMIWNLKGFDNLIRNQYENGFRGILHIPDQYASTRLITYPIMHVDYYVLDGYVYNPAYESVYSDCEQQDVAKIRGQYKLLDRHGLLTHEHYIAGYGNEPDELLKRTENPIVYAKDRRMYEYRKSINFGL